MHVPGLLPALVYPSEVVGRKVPIRSWDQMYAKSAAYATSWLKDLRAFAAGPVSAVDNAEKRVEFYLLGWQIYL